MNDDTRGVANEERSRTCICTREGRGGGSGHGVVMFRNV